MNDRNVFEYEVSLVAGREHDQWPDPLPEDVGNEPTEVGPTEHHRDRESRSLIEVCKNAAPDAWY